MGPETGTGLYARMVLAVALVFGFTFAPLAAVAWALARTWTLPRVLAVALALTAVASALQLAYGYRRTVGRLAVPRADREEYPRLHATLDRLAQQTGRPRPDLAVANSPVPNSVVRGVRQPTIVVTTALLEQLDDDELAAVLAHELAHVANRDTLAMVYAATPALLAFDFVRWLGDRLERTRNNSLDVLVALAVGIVFGVVSEAVFRVFARQREYAADRAAAATTGDPAALAGALATIDETVADLPTADLRAQDGGAKALCIVPQAFEHRPTREEPSGTADWSTPGGIEAIYGDQPMDRLEEREADRARPIDLPSPAHPPTDERIRRLQAML